MPLTPPLYAALIESALDAIIVMDHEGRVLEFNTAASRMFGYPREEALGRELAALIIPPWLRERHRAGLARHLATGEAPLVGRRLEITGWRADGTEFPIELTVVRLGEAGPPLFAGFVLEVTDRRRKDQALRLSDERFQLVTRATQDTVWDWDLRAGSLWWNDAFQTVYGYHPEDIEPGIESWTTRLHPADLARVKASIAAVIEGDGATWSDEYRFARRDGTYADVFDRGYVIRDELGTAVRMVGVMIDLTARKRAGEQLRAAEERFRQLAENIQQVFWMTDPRTHEVLYVSPAYETIWGRTVQSLYASPRAWIETVHPEDRQRIVEAASRQAEGGYDETYRIVRPDGSLRWIQDRAFPVRNADGAVYRIAGTATDITERRELEEQLRQSQKMESVGRLAGGIAHDFNNLLTVINGTADLVLSDLPKTHELRRDIEEIRLAGDRAATLTRQLLALSRQQILQPEVLKLSAVVGRMQGMLRRMIGEDVDLVFTLPNGSGNIEADPGQIEQVILNLAVNARDAMPEGGTLTIEVCDVHLDAGDPTSLPSARPGPHVALIVRDTGSGMDDATRQRIFEPFFTTRPPGKGTGLGLSTVYGIVEQSGGSISVSSKPGRGTTFMIYFPRVARAPSPARPAPGPAGVPLGTETILLVEDESRLRALVMRILSAEGYTVLEAGSGEEALSVAASHAGPVDLLLTDVVMPGMNGRELAARLSATRPDTRVLFMSGYTDDAILRHGVLDDASQFIGKPYTPRELKERVRAVLAS